MVGPLRLQKFAWCDEQSSWAQSTFAGCDEQSSWVQSTLLDFQSPYLGKASVRDTVGRPK